MACLGTTDGIAADRQDTPELTFAETDDLNSSGKDRVRTRPAVVSSIV